MTAAAATSSADATRADQRNAVLAGFLGWTFDAFDFFLLTFVLAPVAAEFHQSIPKIALALAASLSTRWIGAILFGLLADRYGRRIPLIVNILFYSLVEVLSGLAPSYGVFLGLRFLYGVGMGGEWGVGASLTMESVPARWRGLLSGFLQEGYALGYLLAALAYFFVFPHWGWRPLFFLGGVPALLTLFIRAKVKESAAWHRSRAAAGEYRRAIFAHWPRFLYLVLLLALMNSIAHGTQDIYPTYLQQQRHYTVRTTAIITALSMLGAIAGGLLFGLFSDRRGRRRAMATAMLVALLVIPLWAFAPNLPVILAGAFLMQFLVQGAWGVIPVHLNELSPDAARGFFPGFAYQLGVLGASGIGYAQTVLAAHASYGRAMAFSTAAALLGGAVVVSFGPEAHRIAFGGRGAQRSE
jgi:SHS family lactate transporter-like MFS transporter